MTENQRNAFRTPDALASAWERRTVLVREVMAAHSAANDAKTARLKALRLEKERLEAESAANIPFAHATPRKRGRRVAAP